MSASTVIGGISPSAVVLDSARQASVVSYLAGVFSVVFGDDADIGLDGIITEALDALTTEAGDQLTVES